MTEDELYRTSTQYRLWNFTPEKLASVRASTNALATEHVKAAFKRKRAAKSQPTSTDVSAAASDVEGNGVHNGAAGKKDASKGEKEVQCLTAEEEKKIIDFYCANLLQMATKPPFEFPINVVVRYCAK
jgi:cyclin H